MPKYTEKSCPSCGQRLRFPKDVGGVVMACPSCGNKFYSEFKIGVGRSIFKGGLNVPLFNMPKRILKRIFGNSLF